MWSLTFADGYHSRQPGTILVYCSNILELTFLDFITPLNHHLEKAMATHSSTLAWKIPWAEEPSSQTRLSDLTFTFHFHSLEKEMATHSSVLAWIIPGTREPDGLPSMGSHRVGHHWSNSAASAAAAVIIFSFQLHWSCFHLLHTCSLHSIIHNSTPTWSLLFPPISFWIPTVVLGVMCASSLSSLSQT